MNLLTKLYFTENDTIDEVRNALELLQHDLPLMDMSYLCNFNRTYLTITRNVIQAKKTHTFQHIDFLDTFDARFAHYYTNALQKYFIGDDIAPAWKIAFDHAKNESCTPLMAMALGVNAHVNNDIPQVLLDTSAQEMHYSDFTKVNTVIGDSLDEALDDVNGSESLLNPDSPIFRPAYKIAIKQLIKKWRQQAWDAYVELRAGRQSVSDIESHASGAAHKLLIMPI